MVNPVLFYFCNYYCLGEISSQYLDDKKCEDLLLT